MISKLTRHLFETLDLPEKEALASRPEDLLQLRSRRETLKRFRNQWDGRGNWAEAFIAWLPTDQSGDRGEGRVLIGTQLARAIHAVGGDKVAAAYTRKTGRDCGCGKREEKLNEADRKVRAGVEKVKQKILRA